jgi:hypothetical protein
MATHDDEFEKRKWAHERAKKDAERAHDQHHEEWSSRNRAAVDAAQLALRSAILVNGGAAVALLAFIGSLAAQGRVGASEIGAVANSLLWFAGGVAFALLATLAAYIVNLLRADSVAAKKPIWDHPWVSPTPRSTRLLSAARVLHVLAILVGLTSLGCFVTGIVDVKNAVSKIGTAQLTSPHP